MSEDYKLIGALNRQPNNPNVMLDNKFTFIIRKLSEVSFNCRSANIPAISIPYTWQTTLQNPIPRPGLNMTYEPFEIEFILDEDLNNYTELMAWMIALSMPVNGKGWSQLKAEKINPEPDNGLVSDAVLTILTNESVPNRVVFFRDAFPISLNEIRFTNNTDNPNEQACTARFIYSWFDIETAD